MLRKRYYSILILIMACQCTSASTERDTSPAGPSSSASYYVSTSGNDDNHGTSPEEAWETIDRANALACSPGDSILFEGGHSFSGSLFLDPSDQGTPLDPITIGSYGNGRATIRSGDQAGLYASNTAAIELKDLAFVGSGRDDPGGADGISFHVDTDDGIRLEYIRIENVDVSAYRGAGIQITAGHPSGSGFEDVRITNSVVHDNGDRGIASSGVWPPDPANRPHRNIYVGYCKVHDNHGAGYGLFQFFGASPHRNNIVRYNISENDGLIGYGPISFWATISGGGIRNTEIYNNTLYVSSDTGSAGISDAPPGASFVYNTKVYNNIIVTEAGKKAIRIPRSSGGWSFQGNCYWTYGGPVEIEWNGNAYTSLAEWRTATGQERVGRDDVGLEADPALLDPGNGGTVGDPTQLFTLAAYRLHPDSPAIDAALDLPVLFGIDPGFHDFYGASIPQFLGYDLGAHEFDQTPITSDRIE